MEFILNESGVGIRQLNPYVRELYILNEDMSNPRLITMRREDLELFPARERIVFVIEPDPTEAKRIWFFLNKFINPDTTALQMIGRDLLIVSSVAEIKELLKIYDFVSMHRGTKEYKAIKVRKVDVEEMARVLATLFESIMEDEISHEPFSDSGDDSDENRGPRGGNNRNSQ